MSVNIDELFGQIKSIHALANVLPATISPLLDATIIEMAQPNDEHPRRIFIGAPKEQRPSSAQIKGFRISIHRQPDAPFDQIMWLDLELPERITTKLLLQHFGQPTDLGIPEPPVTEIYWSYVEGRRIINFEIEEGQLKSVIITKTALA